MLAIIGGFSVIGSAASGWPCDRFNPRFQRAMKILARRPDRNRAGRRAGKDRPPRPRTEISNPSFSSGESCKPAVPRSGKWALGPVLAAAEVGSGWRVLDISTGTGEAALMTLPIVGSSGVGDI
jgi:hypothetical protein